MKRGSKHSDATRALLSKKMRGIYANPDLRERVAKRTAETWRDGSRPTSHSHETRKQLSVKMREVYSDPSLRERVSRNMSEIWRLRRALAPPAPPPTGGERLANPPDPPNLGALSE